MLNLQEKKNTPAMKIIMHNGINGSIVDKLFKDIPLSPRYCAVAFRHADMMSPSSAV